MEMREDDLKDMGERRKSRPCQVVNNDELKERGVDEEHADKVPPKEVTSVTLIMFERPVKV